MKDQTVTFVKSIVERFPSLTVLLKEHLHDNFGEILPHVFLGDLTRYILTLERTVSSSGNPESGRELRQILNFLEASYLSGDQELQELIGVSFLEDLPRLDEDGGQLRSMLGPTLSAELRRMEQ